jgi:hypothetical protein
LDEMIAQETAFRQDQLGAASQPSRATRKSAPAASGKRGGASSSRAAAVAAAPEAVGPHPPPAADAGGAAAGAPSGTDAAAGPQVEAEDAPDALARLKRCCGRFFSSWAKGVQLLSHAAVTPSRGEVGGLGGFAVL